MSFVNLMSDTEWTDADITTRTEAMVRAVVSVQEELVLNRKVQGAALGEYVLSPEDQAQMARLAEAGRAAQLAGVQARADAELLRQAIQVERAQQILGSPSPELPSLLPEPDLQGAQEIIDAASAEVMELVGLRAAARA